MNIDALPFLHYMVRIDGGGEPQLLSPSEVEDNTTTGGSFVVPVQGDGELLPAYRFHFSIYLGHGEFVKDRDRTSPFQRNCTDAPDGTKGSSPLDVRATLAGTVLASSLLASLT